MSKICDSHFSVVVGVDFTTSRESCFREYLGCIDELRRARARARARNSGNLVFRALEE